MTAAIINQIFIGELLVRKRVITRSQLRECLAIQRQTKQKLGQIILEKRLLSPKELSLFLKEQHWRNFGYWVIGD
jgi:UDP-glucose 4-epimerase